MEDVGIFSDLEDRYIAVYIKNSVGVYAAVNRVAAGVIESSIEKVLGKTDRELFEPAAANFISDLDSQALESGQILHSDFVIRSNGRWMRIISFRASVQLGPNERGIIGVSLRADKTATAVPTELMQLAIESFRADPELVQRELVRKSNVPPRISSVESTASI